MRFGTGYEKYPSGNCFENSTCPPLPRLSVQSTAKLLSIRLRSCSSGGAFPCVLGFDQVAVIGVFAIFLFLDFDRIDLTDAQTHLARMLAGKELCLHVAWRG